jgi:L-threonylcarbamoyladenylate synthase
MRAPGQLASHYAPRTRLKLIDDANSFSPTPNQRCALLAWRPVGNCHSSKFLTVHELSKKQDLREAAANLFRYLHELDELDLDLIVAERVPSAGLGAAINERLQRAAAK